MTDRLSQNCGVGPVDVHLGLGGDAFGFGDLSEPLGPSSISGVAPGLRWYWIARPPVSFNFGPT